MKSSRISAILHFKDKLIKFVKFLFDYYFIGKRYVFIEVKN